MQLNEMILLIRNEKGHETNMLVTFEDYVKDWIYHYWWQWIMNEP